MALSTCAAAIRPRRPLSAQPAMAELKDFIGPVLALVGTLAVAAVGWTQWRRQHGSPNRAVIAEARRQAAEALWTQLEEINLQLRHFGEDSRRIALHDDLQRLNALFFRHSLYLDDAVQQHIHGYVKQLHAVAEAIARYQVGEEWSDTLANPSGRSTEYREINAQLDQLATQRATVKTALLRAAER